jgi:pantetheine-phosphate adenylyltransferase
MEKVAVFPGSFDPITKGHEAIINKASSLFDKIVVAIGVNSSKKYMFSLEERIRFCKATFNESNISIDTYEGLTIDYCSNIGARYLLRGLRTSADFEYESGIAQMNKAIKSETETIFMLAPLELSAISSTIVRDILKNGGDVSQFIPSGIQL